ncbi:MAG TPA: type II toxin-antitoxin system VapC family toxin [Candidatus Limnocylindrales bacterium]|nr:type II toxin-antitoxin system VapC family toxin [Candidatus Limnocylindrales bacterium]
MTSLAYVDASALVKLVLAEAESLEMVRWYVESDRVLTSRIGIIETRRAVARRPHDPVHLERVLSGIEVISVTPRLGDLAATINPAGVRTLDAIHLATALGIGGSLTSFVTYDDRLADAARALGLPVVSSA